MEGMSERAYAAHAGLSRGAIQKAKVAGRLVLHADGSIDAVKSDASRGAGTDPSKQRRDATATTPRKGGSAKKEVPDTAVSAVGDTLRQQGLTAPTTGGGTTFLQAKTAHEVLKAQERQTRLARLRGELVDRDRATSLVFRLAREERDAWVTWPARVAALMAAETGIEVAVMQGVLEAHVRAHLDELAEPRIAFN